VPLIILTLMFLATTLHAAEIDYKPYRSSSNKLLHIEGTIESGDYDKIIDIIKKDPEYYINNYTIVVNSSGGNTFESIKIGNLISNTYKKIQVENICASSCFNIFISAIDRDFGNGKLGVHRPYFQEELLASLSPEDAEKQKNIIMALVRDFLKGNSVPQNLIDRMFDTQSTKTYWLNKNDINMLGNTPSWFNEFINVMCDYNDRYDDINKWYMFLNNYNNIIESLSETDKIEHPEITDIKKYYELSCRKQIINEESRNYVYNILLSEN